MHEDKTNDFYNPERESYTQRHMRLEKERKSQKYGKIKGFIKNLSSEKEIKINNFDAQTSVGNLWIKKNQSQKNKHSFRK